jgi:hypothetical protein
VALPGTFDEAVGTGGFYRTEVGSEIRYVTRDGGRAVIGPLSHRKRKNKKNAPPAYTGSRLMTPEDVGIAHANLNKAFAGVNEALRNMKVPTLRPVVPPTQEPAKKPKRGRVRALLARVRANVEDWFWLPEWHQAVRHVAIDLLVWVLCLGTAAVIAKCAWWVVSA